MRNDEREGNHGLLLVNTATNFKPSLWTMRCTVAKSSLAPRRCPMMPAALVTPRAQARALPYPTDDTLRSRYAACVGIAKGAAATRAAMEEARAVGKRALERPIS